MSICEISLMFRYRIDVQNVYESFFLYKFNTLTQIVCDRKLRRFKVEEKVLWMDLQKIVLILNCATTLLSRKFYCILCALNVCICLFKSFKKISSQSQKIVAISFFADQQTLNNWVRIRDVHPYGIILTILFSIEDRSKEASPMTIVSNTGSAPNSSKEDQVHLKDVASDSPCTCIMHTQMIVKDLKGSGIRKIGHCCHFHHLHIILALP